MKIKSVLMAYMLIHSEILFQVKGDLENRGPYDNLEIFGIR